MAEALQHASFGIGHRKPFQLFDSLYRPGKAGINLSMPGKCLVNELKGCSRGLWTSRRYTLKHIPFFPIGTSYL